MNNLVTLIMLITVNLTIWGFPDVDHEQFERLPYDAHADDISIANDSAETPLSC